MIALEIAGRFECIILMELVLEIELNAKKCHILEIGESEKRS